MAVSFAKEKPRSFNELVFLQNSYLDFGHSSGITGNVYQPVECILGVFSNI
jgi:hypothetical protein